MRLGIVVPYRDREEHFRKFIPHVSAFFARDLAASAIELRVLFVEQSPQKPFNRGALKNIGFALLENDVDYVCFHDVDYLPIWADYSPVVQPTTIIWYGAEIRPLAPGRSNEFVKHDPESIYGGVVITDLESFRRVNGYSNNYWGWGFEDMDLYCRCAAQRIGWGRRKGTFLALDHDNEGFNLAGGDSEISKVNEQLFRSMFVDKTASPDFGYRDVRYSILSRSPISNPQPEGRATWETVTVVLKSKPSKAQVKAMTARTRAA